MSDDRNPKDIVGINKPQLNLIPPASLVYQALGMQNGAEKYGAFNWRAKKVLASIYVAATLRHVFAWADGEEVADDSRLPHLAHALACLGIIVDALEGGNLVDDRPIPGPFPRLIAEHTKGSTLVLEPRREPDGGVAAPPDSRIAVPTSPQVEAPQQGPGEYPAGVDGQLSAVRTANALAIDPAYIAGIREEMARDAAVRAYKKALLNQR